MSNVINSTKSLANVAGVEELSNETASAICGGGAITLYEHADFNRGTSGMVRRYIGVTPKIDQAFNDKASSAKVRGGKWVLYRDEQYNIPLLTLPTGDYRFLGARVNDRVSSIGGARR